MGKDEGCEEKILNLTFVDEVKRVSGVPFDIASSIGQSRRRLLKALLCGVIKLPTEVAEKIGLRL